MEEWWILGQALVRDSRVEDEEKRKSRKQELKYSHSEHFLTWKRKVCQYGGV